MIVEVVRLVDTTVDPFKVVDDVLVGNTVTVVVDGFQVDCV